MEVAKRLSILGLGLAFAVWWGLSILIMGLYAAFFQFGKPLVALIGTMYIGYNATVFGSLIGTVWAVVDGFIAGIILAWFYNIFTARFCK